MYKKLFILTDPGQIYITGVYRTDMITQIPEDILDKMKELLNHKLPVEGTVLTYIKTLKFSGEPKELLLLRDEKTDRYITVKDTGVEEFVQSGEELTLRRNVWAM